jgi:hypothetical protein
MRTPCGLKFVGQTITWGAEIAPDQLFLVVETVGLEPTAFCLQSRCRRSPDQGLFALSQVTADFSFTL